VFLLFAMVLGQILRAARQLWDRAKLKASVAAYIYAFGMLYGDENIVPKFHYLFHMADHPRLFSCFVLERKHKDVKRFQNDLFNCNVEYGRNILRAVTDHQLGKLQLLEPHHWTGEAVLIKGHAASAAVFSRITVIFPHLDQAACTVSQSARAHQFEIVCVRDVVLYRKSDGSIAIGDIAQLLDTGAAGPIALIKCWEEISSHKRCWKLRTTDSVEAIYVSSINTAVVWSGEGASTRTVIKPLHAFAWATV